MAITERSGPPVNAGSDAPASTLDSGDRQRVARAGMWTAAGFVVSATVSPALTVVLVRVLPASAYASLVTATAVVTLAAALTGFGLSAAVARAMAQASIPGTAAGPETTYVTARRLVAQLCAAAAVVAVVAVAVVQAVPALRPAIGPLVVMLPAIVLAPVLGFGTGLARAGFAGRTIAAASAVPSLVVAVLALLALATGSRSPLVIAGARVSGAVAAVAVVVHYLARNRPRGPGLRAVGASPIIRRQMAAFAGAMLLAVFLGSAISQLDVVVLAAVRGGRAAADYAPVSRVADALMALPPLLGTFFLPAVTRSIAGGEREHTARLYHWASRWNLVVCAPALGVAMAVPRSVLDLLFGAGYGAFGGPLRILAAGVAANVLLGFNGITLDAYGMPGKVAIRQGAAIAVDVVACIALVPVWGLTGAAAATTIGLVVANLLCSWVLYARFRVGPWDRAVVVTVVAAVAATTAVAASVPRLVGSDLARIVVAGLVVALVTGVAAVASGGAGERNAIVAQARRRAGAISTRLGHER